MSQIHVSGEFLIIVINATFFLDLTWTIWQQADFLFISPLYHPEYESWTFLEKREKVLVNHNILEKIRILFLSQIIHKNIGFWGHRTWIWTLKCLYCFKMRKLTYHGTFKLFVFIVFKIMQRIGEKQFIKLNLWHNYLKLYKIRTTNFYTYKFYKFLTYEGKKNKHINFSTFNAL